MSLSKKIELKRIARLLARELRNKQTGAEKLLWQEIRKNKIEGFKFRRQHPFIHDELGPESFFIVDFYCPDLNIVIEIDGGYHKATQEKDELRDYIFSNNDITVLRFTNKEVYYSLENVIKQIRKTVILKNQLRKYNV